MRMVSSLWPLTSGFHTLLFELTASTLLDVLQLCIQEDAPLPSVTIDNQNITRMLKIVTLPLLPISI